jgi:hypothetical protein
VSLLFLIIFEFSEILCYNIVTVKKTTTTANSEVINMQRIYVITFRQSKYSSQVIGATADATKISAIIADYANSIRNTICDDDCAALDYLADPTKTWHVTDVAIGKTLCGGKGRMGVEITVTTLM